MGVNRRWFSFSGGAFAALVALAPPRPANAGKSAKRRRKRLKKLAAKNYNLCVAQTPFPPDTICYLSDVLCCRYTRNPDLNQGWRNYCGCLAETSCSQCEL